MQGLETELDGLRDDLEDAEKAFGETTVDALDAAQAAVEAKEAELAARKAAVVAEDPDADVDADSEVQTLQAELTALEGELTAARTAYEESAWNTLTRWENSVPDDIWANLAAYERALQILTSLTADSSALVTDLEGAETALVAALESEEASERLVAALEAEKDAAAGQMAFYENAWRSRHLSAVRGEL